MVAVVVAVVLSKVYLAASAPLSAIPETLTVLLVPAFAVSNVAVVYVAVTSSPTMKSALESVTVASLVPSYVLLIPVASTVTPTMFLIVMLVTGSA